MKTLIIFLLVLSCTMETIGQKQKALKVDSTATLKRKYTCILHPEMTGDQPGHYTKCGRALTLSNKEQLKTSITQKYACVFHPDAISEKPGKCLLCNKPLQLSKKEQLKADVVKLYVCPVHPNITSNHIDKCSDGGMVMK